MYYPQYETSISFDTDTISQTTYGSFENYAFVVDGKLIQQNELIDYPGAKLYKIYPYSNIELGGREYQGAVYFYTPEQATPPPPYADDPAWFINGKQVSPFDIRSSQPELYTKITKSAHDTVIDGMRYKGSIHVDTDEDFFAGRIALPEILRSYTNSPTEQVIVHWYSPMPISTTEPDIGGVIADHFPIYHLDQDDSTKIKADRIPFTTGRPYVIQLIDGRYNRANFSGNKARAIFEDPLTVDTDCPCYLANFNSADYDVFNAVELMPKTEDEEAYLKKLSTSLGLSGLKTSTAMESDSITVRFFVTRASMLAELESMGPDKSGHKQILQAIKRSSCLWSAGIQSGRPQVTRRKMTIFYSRDLNGNIRSLDSLAY